MEAYSQEFAEKKAKKPQETLEKSENEEEDKEKGANSPKREATPQSCLKYNLRGVLLHSGTAESGHYTSLIRDRYSSTEAWFEFNDSHVTPFDLKNLEDEAFGGQETK